jgi:transposase InsO family protein
MLKQYTFPTSPPRFAHIIARHCTGSVLVTDQGTSFTSVFFRETCRMLGIKQFHSSAHPQANGVVEKYHQTMSQGSSHYMKAYGIL